MKIKEVIVVEGKNDTNTLKQFLDCDTIETCGTHLSKAKMKLLEEVNKTRGIIVFTDPDAPGEMIRNKINSNIKGVKNAFIMKEKAKTTKKVGIEHANKQDILDSLNHLVTYKEEYQESISKEAFYNLGFQGRSDSAKLREKIGDALFIGKCNAKTLYKRLNLLQISATELETMIKEIYE